MRVLQFVRARIVWRSVPGLTVPITAVIRIGGQYFCFVAEAGQHGGLVARQKPIEVGEMIGNDYVVTQRPQGGRAADRLWHSEDRRRRAGARPSRRAIACSSTLSFAVRFSRRSARSS